VFLSPDELADLTGLRRPKAQRSRLRDMGIPCIDRPDGTFVVLRSVVVALGGGMLHETRTEPNWGALHGP
jgi:hypothetical protein